GQKQTELKAKDLKTDQEVRWCPGCGDYVILNAVQSFLPSLGIAREDMVIVSGIGCSSRFPYYMNTYGMHSIHGRAPAIATGLAAEHEGAALVELYQNCNIFNDGAFDLLKDPATGTQWSIPLVHGKPLVFGPDGASCVVRDDSGGLRIAETNQVDAADIVVHDAQRQDPSYAFALSRLSSQDLRYTPMGVFRSVQKPTYDAMMAEQ